MLLLQGVFLSECSFFNVLFIIGLIILASV
jgi:hypothetical protein